MAAVVMREDKGLATLPWPARGMAGRDRTLEGWRSACSGWARPTAMTERGSCLPFAS